MTLHQPAHAMASLTATAIVRLTSPLAKSNIASRDLVKFLVIFFRVSNATSYYPQNVVSFSYELKMIIITLDIFRYWLQQHFLWSFLTKKKVHRWRKNRHLNNVKLFSFKNTLFGDYRLCWLGWMGLSSCHYFPILVSCQDINVVVGHSEKYGYKDIFPRFIKRKY